MKDYLHPKKLLISSITFFILILFPGCVSYRIIPASDLSNYTKYHFTVISKSENFNLINAEVTNNILTGKIDKLKSFRNNVIKVYLSSGSVLKIGSENSVSIPLDRVAKIEKSDFGIEKNQPAPKLSKTNYNNPFSNPVLDVLYVLIVTIAISFMINTFHK
jgi:hypothetical protein